MKVPIKDEEFPVYFILPGKALAFLSKDKMYKVEPIGSNKNPGVTIDHYITRSMVVKHWPQHNEKRSSPEEFKLVMSKLFTAYINKIVSL